MEYHIGLLTLFGKMTCVSAVPIVSILLMILVGTLCGEIYLTKRISRNQLFANERKKWLQYVWKFAAEEFEKVFEKEHRYLGITKYIIYRLKVLFKTASIIRYFAWIKNKTNVSHVITLPVGTIKKAGENENIVTQSITPGEYYYNIETWEFTLDKQLRINITFYYIRIIFNVLSECYLGNVTIKSLLENQPRNSFVYCGVLSNMAHYGMFPDIEITVSLRPYVTYNITLFYGVIDSNATYNCPHIRFTKQIPHIGNEPGWLLYFPTTKQFLQKIHISIARFNTLKITTYANIQNSIQIYDGPGILSKMVLLNINRTSFETSTFQCVLHIFGKVLHSTENDVIWYVSVHRPALFNRWFNPKTLPTQTYQWDGNYNFQTLLKFELGTNYGFYFNCTIHNFKHNYKGNNHCTRGGLLIYDITSHTFVLLSNTCLMRELTDTEAYIQMVQRY